ncbi:ATP-binding cassette domain-containing protein [Frankia sp. CNm7]|uniref:ATP-binding cassette domain-containing protein n=1 Tax=Frankia nepalensis TaxID=1836974 RepID=A0A937REH3_9ACTN|nr:ATP-binding cassette domain-containing protein [Frankia nepalensis]MBL7496640.1 ATP-binding cassette domain-containing protein [Frankia nepalensis]MBL7511898.1 ATP-binding cassette domain-containing protein [Frankia nepalensis]MBL7516649.1 ATP-binding cassette domain-containing protein [Frankia nepalensis]MBL7627379.1 ATP-binding cassette domain-containing protein [Frankia nepalensis]
MSDFVRAVLTGAIAGGIYSLIGVGLVVTYTVTGIFDLAYGGVAFAAALTFYELNSGLGWNRFLAAALVVFVLGPLIGLLLERLVYRRLATADDAVKLVTSVGLLVALPATALLVIEKGNAWGGWDLPSGTDVPSAPGLLFQPAESYKITQGLIITSNELAVIVAAVVLGVGLWLMSRTRFGLQMRAVRDRGDLATLRGVNKVMVGRRTAVLSSMLASVAGVLGAPILSQLDSRVFTLALFVAAAAVVFGRFESVPRTFVGGLVLGVLINLTYRYVKVDSVPQLSQAVPFVLLLLGLLVLGRRRVRLAGIAGTSFGASNWRADLPVWRRLAPSATVLVAFLLLAEFAFDDFWVSLTVRSLAIAVILLSITVMTGLGGMVSLAQAAFSISAALTTGLLVSRYGWPFLPAAVLGILIAVALGVIVALPSLRLGGVPLTLATLALALMGQSLILGWSYLTNASSGWLVSRPVIAGLDLGDDRTLLIVLAVVIGLLTWLISNVRQSSSGRAILALRASPTASSALGVSAVATRLRLVCMSAAIAGLGGVLLLLVDQGVSNDSTSALDGLTWLTIMVVLGVNRPLSAIVGGLSLILMPALVSSGFTAPFNLFSWGGTESAYIPGMLFGLAVIDLVRNPDGALERFSRWRHLRRNRSATATVSPGAGTQAATGAPPVGAAEETAPARTGTGMPAATEAPVDAADPDRDAIVLAGLRAGYDLVEVLHGVDAAFPRGKISVVLGANGAGKSTLLNAMAGIVDIRAGALHERTPNGDDRRPESVALVPEGRGIFPGLTVEDNLRLSLTAPEEVALAFERFPALAQRRGIPAGSLSGGEQQMLALAPMIVRTPPVLLVDEPTLGLAPQIAAGVLDMLRECRGEGTVVVLADEKQSINTAIGEHLVLLALGRVIWEGPSDAVPADALARAYGMTDEHLSDDHRRHQVSEQIASLFAPAPS